MPLPAWSVALRCAYCQRRLRVWPQLPDAITFRSGCSCGDLESARDTRDVSLHRCDAKNCPVVGAVRSDGNRLSCFACNYDLCEMCARR